MGLAHIPQKVKLITGLIAGDTALFEEAKRKLEKAFSNTIDFESNIIDFVHTAYYADEMGRVLKRKFLSFKKLVDLRKIYIIKLASNKIERRYSKNGKRSINIDPGYLDMSKLVLFSTKDYTHRIYLDRGIYAEVTLFYKDKTFNPWPWTYPDYKTDTYIGIFNNMRERYREQRGA